MKLNYIKVFIPILVMLLGVFVYISRHDEKSGDAIVPLAERYHLNSSTVAMVEYTSAKGVMRATRTDDAWQMSQPGDFPADGEIISSFLDQLLAIQPDRILADLPPDKLAEFGLDQPQSTIQLSDNKQVLLNLRLGGKNASGSSYYAQVENDGAVLTLPVVQLEEQILSQEPNSFRSRHVFRIDPEALATIEVSYPGHGRGYTLQHQPDGWMITAPFSYRAKERLIDTTLRDFEDLRVTKFLPTSREAALVDSDMGLMAPSAIVKLINVDGTSQELQIGSPGGDLGALYATSSALPEAFLTQQHIADKVNWTDQDIKEDRLVVFASDSIAGIEVRLRGADNLLLERAADGNWNRTKPTTLQFGQDDITPLLKALIELAPKEYVPEAESGSLDESDLGFSEYILKVELKKADTFKSQLLTIGKLHRRRGFFTRDSLTPGIYLLPEPQVRALESQIDKIRGGNAPDEGREAWSDNQKQLAEDNAEKALADEKKDKKKKKKPGSSATTEKNGTGMR